MPSKVLLQWLKREFVSPCAVSYQDFLPLVPRGKQLVMRSLFFYLTAGNLFTPVVLVSILCV